MDKDEIDAYVKAGEIAKEVKSFARGIIGRGVKLIDVAEGIDAKIVELGGEIAFPVNLSMNEVAAHFTPEPDCDKVAGGILKVDVGVCIDGYIADTAFSVDLTEDGEFGEMIELNEKILSAISDRIFRGVGVSGCRGVGLKVRDIGEAAQDTLEEWNKEKGVSFSIIKGLSGHTLGQRFMLG